jgi:hypothetical protein
MSQNYDIHPVALSMEFGEALGNVLEPGDRSPWITLLRYQDGFGID